MLKENSSNAYFDLLEQYNIFLEGEKRNGNAAFYADQMFQVLDPIFGNTKEKLESNQLDIGLYSIVKQLMNIVLIYYKKFLLDHLV